MPSGYCGIMVYVHFRGMCGISIENAKQLCYPFDHFIGLTIRRPEDLNSLDLSELIKAVEAAMTKSVAAGA